MEHIVNKKELSPILTKVVWALIQVANAGGIRLPQAFPFAVLTSLREHIMTVFNLLYKYKWMVITQSWCVIVLSHIYVFLDYPHSFYINGNISKIWFRPF